MNILIVDDETAMANSLRIGLETKGYRAVHAYSGRQALDFIVHGDQTVNLVIADYLMPGMNGFELIKALRKTIPTLPVIIMTAYAEKNLAIKALKIRCDGFIEKPFNLDQLVEEIERIRLRLLDKFTSDDLRQLLPRIVHQINNPLAAIHGYADLILLNKDNSEKAQCYAEKILMALNLIRRINKDIMNGSWEKGQTFHSVDLNSLLDDCLEIFQGIFILNGIRVKRDVSTHNLFASGDHSLLEHVFNNLILNAIEAMDGRPDKILMVSLRSSQDLSSIEFIIEDTGCGIRTELLERIFEPYFTSKSQGNGLGLVVIKNCIEKHYGKIFVESCVDAGSRFTISLPAAQMT